MLSKYCNCMCLLKINNKLKIVCFFKKKAGRIFDTLWVFLIKLALVGCEMIIANSYPTCTCARMTDQPPFPGGENFLWWPLRESSVWNGNLFKGLGIWKGRDFTCWSKYMKGSGNLSFWLVQRPKWANRFILWSWKGQENVLLLWFIHILKKLPLQWLKGINSS